jgi:hypothetical protein
MKHDPTEIEPERHDVREIDFTLTGIGTNTPGLKVGDNRVTKSPTIRYADEPIEGREF